MPINYFQPIDSLRNLSGSGFSPIKKGSSSISGIESFDENPDAQLYNLQDQRLSELKDNAARGLIMAAPQNTKDELESDISNNPITRQGAQVNDYLGKQRAAQMSGFSTPQEEAAYTQRIGEEKLRQPADIEKMKSQTELEHARIAGKSAVDVASKNAETYGNRADVELLKTLLAVQGRGDVATGNNVSKQLADLEKQHTIGVSGRKISDADYTRRKAEIQAQSGNQGGGGMTSKGFAQKLRQDYPNASIDELLTMSQSPDNLMGGIDDPGELAKLRQHFMALGAR